VTEEIEQCLKEYLICHESDIAIGINDFADLREVFICLLGREAEDVE